MKTLSAIAQAILFYGRGIREDCVGKVVFMITPIGESDIPEILVNWCVSATLELSDRANNVKRRAWKGQGEELAKAISELHADVHDSLADEMLRHRQQLTAFETATLALDGTPPLSTLWATTDPEGDDNAATDESDMAALESNVASQECS